MKLKPTTLPVMALMIVLSFICPAQLSATLSQDHANILSIQGKVVVYEINGQARTLSSDDSILPGERIITSSLSKISLQIGAASLMLQADSSLSIPLNAEDKLQLDYGQIDGSYTPKRRSDRVLGIETPIGALLVEHGQFSLSSDYNEVQRELTMIALNRNAKLELISKIESQIAYGRSYHLDLAFIPTLTQSTNIPLPPWHSVIIRFSQDHPQYSDHIDTARHHGPHRKLDITLTPPPYDSDFGVIVVSPETPL